MYDSWDVIVLPGLAWYCGAQVTPTLLLFTFLGAGVTGMAYHAQTARLQTRMSRGQGQPWPRGELIPESRDSLNPGVTPFLVLAAAARHSLQLHGVAREMPGNFCSGCAVDRHSMTSPWL